MPDIVYPPSRIVETAYGKVEGRRLISEGERKVDAFQVSIYLSLRREEILSIFVLVKKYEDAFTEYDS